MVVQGGGGAVSYERGTPVRLHGYLAHTAQPAPPPEDYHGDRQVYCRVLSGVGVPSGVGVRFQVLLRHSLGGGAYLAAVLVQGYLAHKKPPSSRALPQAYT